MRTIILFSGKSCGYCKPIKIMLDNLKADYEDREDIGFLTKVIDVEPESLELAKSYNVRAIPTVVILSGKNVVDTMLGEEIKYERVVNGIERSL
jgi:thiol-disulfide isomerase/thioredoxin